MALYERVLGNRRPSAIAARVKALREQAAQDRRYLAQLDVLLSDEAVKLVHERAARAELQGASPQRKPAERRKHGRRGSTPRRLNGTAVAPHIATARHFSRGAAAELSKTKPGETGQKMVSPLGSEL